MIATAIKLSSSTPGSPARLSLQFPVAKTQVLFFQDDPLQLFEGDIVVQGELEGKYQQPVKLELILQACDQQHCLPPEKRELILAVRH